MLGEEEAQKLVRDERTTGNAEESGHALLAGRGAGGAFVLCRCVYDDVQPPCECTQVCGGHAGAVFATAGNESESSDIVRPAGHSDRADAAAAQRISLVMLVLCCLGVAGRPGHSSCVIREEMLYTPQLMRPAR